MTSEIEQQLRKAVVGASPVQYYVFKHANINVFLSAKYTVDLGIQKGHMFDNTLESKSGQKLFWAKPEDAVKWFMEERESANDRMLTRTTWLLLELDFNTFTMHDYRRFPAKRG